MKSHERLKTSLEHKEPDRVPFDFGSTKMTGITIGAYSRFLKYKGWEDLDPEPAIFDKIQQLAGPSENFLSKIKSDTRGIFPSPVTIPAADEGHSGNDGYMKIRDEWGIGWRMPEEGGLYYDLYSSPLISGPDSDIRSGYMWPDGSMSRRFAEMDADIIAKGSSGAGLVMHGFTSGVFEMYQRLRGYENAFVDMLTDEESAERFLDKITDAKIAYWDKALGIADGRISVAVEVDDLGTQNSLLISRELYRRILMPRHKRLFSFIKKKSPGIRIFLHSCGAVSSVIPDLIEAGIDILNPVQTSAADMDPAVLKRDFGNDLVFWGGGADTQNILPRGSPAEVRENVRRNIEIFAPGGGFVFNTIHNIQADVPPQNIEAMLETLEIYGKY